MALTERLIEADELDLKLEPVEVQLAEGLIANLIANLTEDFAVVKTF